MDYVIITDSASNLTPEYVEKHKIIMVSLKYYIGENEYDSYTGNKNDDWLKEFYSLMRKKESVTTSCVNESVFLKIFEDIVSKGQDFIYFAFSSKLSATYEIAQNTADKLKKKYPNRKMYVLDTKCVCLGLGLAVDYAIRQRNEGKIIDELYQWHEEHKLNISHWFTVDDLFFLKRGGRISAATAIAGTVLGIKPVMHVDDEGRLVNVTKARGRKKSLDMLVDKMEELALEPEKQRVFIAHGDCSEDLEYVKKKIKERLGTKEFETTFINPVIGAHSGPGTIALFFYGKNR